jgi:hypothetical protein
MDPFRQPSQRDQRADEIHESHPTVKKRSITSYFAGIAAKRLSAVEANPARSNQHELNGVHDLRRILGESRLEQVPARFVFLGADEDETVSADGFVTWYDARQDHPSRSEYRLYFSWSAATEQAAEGDLIFVCRKRDGTILVIITRAGTTAENQMCWLFALPVKGPGMSLQTFDDGSAGEIRADFVHRMLIERLGIETEPETMDELLTAMLGRFSGGFPPTKEFSAFSRESLKEISAVEDPDGALMSWMEREESLFRTLEKHLVAEHLRTGFGTDVDSFMEFSLGVHNRRKSRAGYALENHLECVFNEQNVAFSRNKITERSSRPDFIFPGAAQYHDTTFPSDRLFMLGVKSTSKDRWRQVLAEADRITRKHLFTLEPGISPNQTTEMRARNLQLVVPAQLHASYNAKQQDWLINLGEFVHDLKHNL